jgi:hypothetical protein
MRRRWLSAAVRWGLTGLTAAVIVAWVGSRWWVVNLQRGDERMIFLSRGGIYCDLAPRAPMFSFHLSPGFHVYSTYFDGNPSMVWRFHRFRFSGIDEVLMPLWWIALPLAAGTALAWRTPVRLALGRRRGACLTCGYARAGLAAEAVCPECGTAPAK